MGRFEELLKRGELEAELLGAAMKSGSSFGGTPEKAEKNIQIRKAIQQGMPLQEEGPGERWGDPVPTPEELEVRNAKIKEDMKLRALEEMALNQRLDEEAAAREMEEQRGYKKMKSSR